MNEAATAAPRSPTRQVYLVRKLLPSMLGLAAVILAGCGGGTETPSTAASASPDPTQAAEQRYQDALKKVEDIAFTVPGNGRYVLVENAFQGEMWPGQWRTGDPGPTGPCVWRLASLSGRLIDNGVVRPGEMDTVVTITEVGSVFASTGCAYWRRNDPAPRVRLL